MKNKDFPAFLKLLEDSYGAQPHAGESPRAHRAFPGLTVDVATMMETHRQNVQALATVQQMAMDGFQVLTRCAGQMMADLAAAQTDYIRAASVPDITGAKMGDRAVILQKMIDRAADNYYEISDIAHRSGRETSNILRARVSATLGDMKIAADRARTRRAR